MIPIYTPRVFRESVDRAITSGWISSQGEYIGKTTDQLKALAKVPQVVLMNNGTSATHMLFKALRQKHPEVQTIQAPDHVFIAVWNTILQEYPSFEVLAMDPTTLNMRTDEEYIQSLKPNSAVVVVHNGGNIVNVPRLKRIRPDLVFIEDNCEGFLGEQEGIPAGSFSGTLASSVSFFANKTITSGEGGALFTHDKDVYDFIYRTIHHGMSNQRQVYHDLGYNYRMTNLQAALLQDQIEHIQEIREAKQRILETYQKAFSDLTWLRIEEGTRPSDWMAICGVPIPQETLEKQLREKGVEIRPFFQNLHAHGHLRHIPRPEFEIPTTFFMLPSFPDLTPEQQAKVVCSVREVIGV